MLAIELCLPPTVNDKDVRSVYTPVEDGTEQEHYGDSKDLMPVLANKILVPSTYQPWVNHVQITLTLNQWTSVDLFLVLKF